MSVAQKLKGATTAPTVMSPETKPSRKRKPSRNDDKSMKKIHRIMSAFARGESLDFIIAQQKYHDRSLHSTVSEIEHGYQILVAREWQTIPGFRGLPTRCRRYWMESDQQEKAQKVLGALQ